VEISFASRSLLFPALLSAFSLSVGCGEDPDPGTQPQFEQPQILPDNSPICLSYNPVEVNRTQSQNVLLRNDGAQTLVIEGAAITADDDDRFDVAGVTPSEVNFRGTAVTQVRFSPTSPGWDTAFLEVTSNAQNFPLLRLFVLGLGLPEGFTIPNGGDTYKNIDDQVYDPGPRPSNAFDGDGNPACPAELNPNNS
jgi:hypothetical protein